MVNYEGLFFEDEMSKLIKSLDHKKLAKINDKFHITFKYKPNNNEIFNEIVGKSFEVYIVGYGNDGNNSGFEVILPEELEKYYINYEEGKEELKVPHITVSLAEGAKAVNTKNLNFEKLDIPVKLIGKFGLWLKEGKKQFLSYEPYNIKRK